MEGRASFPVCPLVLPHKRNTGLFFDMGKQGIRNPERICVADNVSFQLAVSSSRPAYGRQHIKKARDSA